MQRSHGILLLALIALLLQAGLYYERLPERVASHFDGAGHPNGWSSKGAFFGMFLGFYVVTLAIFAGLPLVIRRLPDARISLPRKEYWLAPERRAETLDYLSRHMHAFGVATVLFFLGLAQLTIQANLTPDKRLWMTGMWILLACYGAFVVIWVIRLLARFLRTGTV